MADAEALHRKLATVCFKQIGEIRSMSYAHAGSRAWVTSMGGLYDAATLRAPVSQPAPQDCFRRNASVPCLARALERVAALRVRCRAAFRRPCRGTARSATVDMVPACRLLLEGQRSTDNAHKREVAPARRTVQSGSVVPHALRKSGPPFLRVLNLLHPQRHFVHVCLRVLSSTGGHVV